MLYYTTSKNILENNSSKIDESKIFGDYKFAIVLKNMLSECLILYILKNVGYAVFYILCVENNKQHLLILEKFWGVVEL